MSSIPSDTHNYQHYHDINPSGSSRVHLGDVHHHGQSPDERAFNAILESLSYPGMTDRRDALAEAHEGTFDWALLEGEKRFLSYRGVSSTRTHDDRDNKVEMNFSSWLRRESGGLFCFTGKPGAGKSTFMYVYALQLSSCYLTTNLPDAKEVSCV